MLKTRIITAVCLFIVFYLALFHLPATGWVIFATVVAGLAAWEWGGLMHWRGTSRVYLGLGLALVCSLIALLNPGALGLGSGAYDAASARSFSAWVYVPSVVFWLLVAPVWLMRRWPLPKSFLGVLVGLLLILPTWLALVQLKQIGATTLIAIMATVWLADIGAYVFGRALGKHKLAPNISPGKTWEGAVGGAVTVLVYGFLLSGHLPDQIAGNPLALLLILALLPVFSVIGDLFESLLKRQSGVKDSSKILPGHGGVLDRIDSLTSTLPAVALAWLFLLP